MTESTRRRRGHAAASARILTAGLSSAAAFGIVAGLAVAAGHDQQPAEPAALPTGSGPAPDSTTPDATTPSEVVVVIRRHWIPAPTQPGTQSVPAAPTPAPRQVASPARPAPVATPAPAHLAAPRPARPVTRTRGS